jgi:tyrosinase
MSKPSKNKHREEKMSASEHFMDTSTAVSFAQHINMMPEHLRAHLKLPRWIFLDLPYNRKDQAALTDIERQRFICAVNALNQSTQNQISTYGQLVEIHNVSSVNHFQHGTPRFLPWHRIYLLVFEQALRGLHPDVTIPYWDWTQSSEQAIPAWLENFTPTVVTPTQTINVIRAPQSPQDLANIASNINNIMQLTDFDSFTAQLEGVHGAVHVWVGGSMSLIRTAPADPIFWMHHANVDRLWWMWQISPQGQGKNPNLPGNDPTTSPVMDPWQYTEPQTRDITALGYTYV